MRAHLAGITINTHFGEFPYREFDLQLGTRWNHITTAIMLFIWD